MRDLLGEMHIKKTRQRLDIVAALEQADKPLSAEELLQKCEKMSLSTVYRNLERLCELGAVEKQTLAKDGRGVYELVSGEHAHYAICLSCHEKIYLHHCPLQDPELEGFTVTGHKIEVYGYCAKCGK